MTEGKTFRHFLFKTQELQTIIVNCIDFSVMFDENVGKYKEIGLPVLRKKECRGDVPWHSFFIFRRSDNMRALHLCCKDNPISVLQG